MPTNSGTSAGEWQDFRHAALRSYSAGALLPGPACHPVAAVSCPLGTPGVLRADIGSDLLHWLVLADTPYWRPLQISEAAVIAAWRAKKRLIRRLTNHPLLLRPPVPAGVLPLPHLAIAEVRSRHPLCRDWLPLLDRLLPEMMADLRAALKRAV